MKAAILRRYGPPSVIALGERPDPTPGPGQIRVRVRASSLNPLDTKLRAGRLRFVMPLRFPAVLGFDFAGEVDALGPEVGNWTEGDLVYGRTDARTGGTHAELALVRAAVVDRIPPMLSFEAAASLPLVAMTALQALQQADLAPGERLLVNGAAGGVGSVAVQIGRAMGATVTGVCSRGSAPLVARLGARVLDYTAGELEETDESFDVILDTVFSGPTETMEAILADGGRYVTTGLSPLTMLRGLFGHVSPTYPRLSCVLSRADGNLMRGVSALVAAGLLVPVIDSVVPFPEIAAAHARLEAGHLRGKVVVSMPAGSAGTPVHPADEGTVGRP
jgi:NADPH:quinone reductase-like Zn-dependent oxidoreductase